MGKMRRYDPHDEEYHQLDAQAQQQWSVKVGGMISNKMKSSVKKKSVKITYISSPLLMRTCHASEFRSVVQQLTGKDSNNHHDDDFIITDDNNNNHPHKNKNFQDQDHQPSWMMMQLQGGGGQFYADGNSRDSLLSLDEEEDCFWKQVATRSVLQQSSPCVVLV